MAAPTHGYWAIRGLAQPIRLMLAYTGVEFVDKRYNIYGGPKVFDKHEWTDEKFQLGLDFANLPYYMEEGGPKLTQTMAIAKYLARRHGLAAGDEEQQRRIDLLEAVVDEWRMKWLILCYFPNYEANKDEYLAYMSEKVSQLSTFLGDRPWFAGERITYVDFLTYELLDQQLVVQPAAFDGHANVSGFLERFRTLAPIAAYIASDQFIEYPIWGPMARFGTPADRPCKTSAKTP